MSRPPSSVFSVYFGLNTKKTVAVQKYVAHSPPKTTVAATTCVRAASASGGCCRRGDDTGMDGWTCCLECAWPPLGLTRGSGSIRSIRSSSYELEKGRGDDIIIIIILIIKASLGDDVVKEEEGTDDAHTRAPAHQRQ